MRKSLALLLSIAMMILVGAAFAEGKLLGYTCMEGTNSFFVALEGAIREIVEANGDQ